MMQQMTTHLFPKIHELQIFKLFSLGASYDVAELLIYKA